MHYFREAQLGGNLKLLPNLSPSHTAYETSH